MVDRPTPLSAQPFCAHEHSTPDRPSPLIDHMAWGEVGAVGSRHVAAAGSLRWLTAQQSAPPPREGKRVLDVYPRAPIGRGPP